MKILKCLENRFSKRKVVYYIYNQSLSLYLMQNFSGMTNCKEEAGLFYEITAFDFIHLCHRENVYDFILIEKRENGIEDYLS